MITMYLYGVLIMKSMRIILIASLILSPLSGALSADPVDAHRVTIDLIGIRTEVRFPSETQIHQHQVKITEDLKKNSLLRLGAKGAMYVGVLGLCYTVFRDYKIVSAAQLQEQTAQNAAWVYALITELKKKFPDISIPQQTPAITTGWGDSMWNFLSFVCQNLALMQVSELVTTKIFHEVSIEWFSKQQTSLESVYEELSALGTDIQALKNGSIYITRYQADRYMNSLIHLHNALVTELEMVIGYIHSKMAQMKGHLIHLHGDAAVGQYLHKRASDLAQKLHDLKENYVLHKNDDERMLTIIHMFDHMQQFSLELNSSLSSFKRFETQMQTI